MGDFYQVNDLNDIKKLNFILRDIYKRLDSLDSRKTAQTQSKQMDMGGNKLTGGPSSHTTATETEFVTKSYLKSREAAELIRENLRPGGKAPLLPPPEPTP